MTVDKKFENNKAYQDYKELYSEAQEFMKFGFNSKIGRDTARLAKNRLKQIRKGRYPN